MQGGHSVSSLFECDTELYPSSSLQSVKTLAIKDVILYNV